MNFISDGLLELTTTFGVTPHMKKLKVLTAAITFLFFIAPAFASGPGSASVRFTSISSVETTDGNFKIVGFTDFAKKAQVEIAGAISDFNRTVVNQFASDMLNFAVQVPLSLTINLDFVNSGNGITRDGVRIISYSVNGSRNIKDAMLVKHVSFQTGATSDQDVFLTGFSLVKIYKNGRYVLRATDIRNNFHQWIGNSSNDAVATSCIEKASGLITNEGFQNKIINIAADTTRAMGNFSSNTNVRSTVTNIISKMRECGIEQSDHRVLLRGSFSSTVN